MHHLKKRYLLIWIGLLLWGVKPVNANVVNPIQRLTFKMSCFNETYQSETKPKTFNFSDHRLSLKLKSQNGKKVQISKMAGKVIFINFWASWCQPCVAEMANINELYKRFKNDDKVVFLMVSMNKNFNKAKKFRENRQLDFDVYTVKGSIPNVMRTGRIPSTFVIDKYGKIAFSHTGLGRYNSREFAGFLKKLSHVAYDEDKVLR